MKKLNFIIVMMLAFFINSCNKEDLTPTNEVQLDNGLRNASTKRFHSVYKYLGSGYNVTEEYANDNSAKNQVIDIDKFILVNSTRVIIESPLSQEYIEEYGENAKAYSQMVTNKVDASVSIPVFGKTLSSSFSNSNTTTNKFDAKYIYSSCNLLIKQKRYRFNATANLLKGYLTNDFTQDLQTLSPQQIVEYYGTHVLFDIFTGAKLEIKFQSETTNQDRTYAARIGITSGVKDLFNVDLSNDVNTSFSSKNFNRKLAYKTRGGDPSTSLVGDLNLDQSNPKINFLSWQNSLTVDNSVLVDFSPNSTILIYELVTDPIKKAQLKSYVDQYLIDNQVNLEFIPKPIFRYYNPLKSSHFYTRTSGSYSAFGYGYEGVAFQAYTYKAPNTVPIYRYFNTRIGDNFYSSDPGAPFGYENLGIEFYAYKQQTPGTSPVHRYFNIRNGAHFYTTNFNHLGYGIPGTYVYEGVHFYAL
jgi:MAC/Perforin domain/Repeat of unknown function (DUF5648)